MKRYILFFTILATNLFSQTDTAKANHYFRKSFDYEIFSQDHQRYLDTAIIFDHTNPYFWQQKSMPYSKMKKYELAMTYLDSAVKYDKTLHWLEYRAFIKCIFQKSYRAAIPEFQFVKLKNEDGNVMDHTFNWHIGLCFLQLNQLDSAEIYFKKSINYRLKQWGQAHHLEHFYLGITYMESGENHKAIEQFDIALKQYSSFSDVQYYKAKILMKQSMKNEAGLLLDTALVNLKKGMSINEDNSYYEEYPYQIKMRWLER
jgi:tetratricopeptide (TPR) repeat protein